MEDLSSKTVFHEVDLSVRDEEPTDEDEEFGNKVNNVEDEQEEETRVNSDEEWNTDLEDEGYNLTRRVIRNDNVREIYLAACRHLNIVPSRCFLKGVSTTTINLNFQGLGPTGTKAVATGLVVDTVSTHLFLAGNLIGHDGVRYVSEMLRENDYITHLDLSENDIDTYGVQMIADIFKVNETLSHLNLSGNRIKGTDAEHIAAVLTLPPLFRNDHYVGLRSLNLSHNELGNEGGLLLGHALGDNETLTELDLSWNQIRKEGISCLSRGIAENNCLKKLDLSSNGVGNEGAELLGKAMIQNRMLEELNLNSNRIGLEGIGVFFNDLSKNEKLQNLKLTNNPITLQGPIVALAALLKSECCVLQELEIADACVPREFFKVLEEVQAVRPKFKVHLAGFMNAKDMCKAEVKTIKDAWLKDPVLVFINFIEERKIKMFDMFKRLDTDRSCTISKDEFITGLMRVGCPLDVKQLLNVIDVIDVDRSGDIDLGEFLDGYDKHKRRFFRMQNSGSRPATGRQSSRPSSRSSSRPSSRSQKRPSEVKTHLEPPGPHQQEPTSPLTSDENGVTLTVPKSATVF